MKHLERSKRVIYAAAHDVSQVEASQGEQQLVEDVPQLRPESYHFSESPLNNSASKSMEMGTLYSSILLE